MKKITTLTEAQIARFPEFVQKWTEIGLSTQPADRLKAEHGIQLAYAVAKLKAPLKIVWTTSPIAQGLTQAIIMNNMKGMGNQVWGSVRASVWDSVWDSVYVSVRDSVGDSVGDSVWASVWASVWDSVGDPVWASVRASVWDSVGDSVWGSVRASVWDSVGASVWGSVRASVWDSVGDSVWGSVRASVWDSVGDSVGDSVWASVWDSVWDSVRASVYASVRDSVRDSVYASVRDSVRDSVWAAGFGQHDANWVGFYDFFRDACSLIEQTAPLKGLQEITESAGWYLPHTHICWISERHHRVCRNSRGQLHSHDGMAVQYPDGWGIWAWNGVRVTEQIILRPDTLTPEQIAKESNAQVRQVMVERVGIERVCQMFKARVLDRSSFPHGPELGQFRDYELLELDLGDGFKRPYCKMVNPSIGVYHIEGVAPGITTVQQALNFRNGLTPEQIDEVNGADWYQQGDVIMRPPSKTYKSQPIILT